MLLDEIFIYCCFQCWINGDELEHVYLDKDQALEWMEQNKEKRVVEVWKNDCLVETL